jgi:hypothetical protein
MGMIDHFLDDLVRGNVTTKKRKSSMMNHIVDDAWWWTKDWLQQV